MDNFSGIADWPVAYHGTTEDSALLILNEGLKVSGTGGITIANRRSKAKAGIYLSPSAEYAAHPTYAQLCEIDVPGRGQTWAQIVLQCRVKPGSFSKEPWTIHRQYWPQTSVPIDLNFRDRHTIEWLVQSSEDVVVTGFLYRELGAGADSSKYGNLATQVKRGGFPAKEDPAFHWIHLRMNEIHELLAEHEEDPNPVFTPA